MKHYRLHLIGLLFLSSLLVACGVGGTATAVSQTTPSNSASTPTFGAQPVSAAELTDTFLPTVIADGDSSSATPATYDVAIPDTGQTICYDSNGQVVTCVGSGQDGAYSSNSPSYTANGDGTVTDNVTGLMWQQTPDLDGSGIINIDDKLSYAEAQAYVASMTLAGYDDWRLPTITELYSLIDFDGFDVSSYTGTDTAAFTPFIDTNYFGFGYGDTAAGERIIEAQFVSSTLYGSTTMNGAATMFGVNFADGRIKGYPYEPMPSKSTGKLFYLLAVRGGGYDLSDFVDNGNGTVSDLATGLMWQQTDSGSGMNWDDAIATCESATTGGYDDWRLPNAKELQALVDYGRSPDITNSAAIDPVFNATQITNEAGQPDYAAYWSSTTHVNTTDGQNAVYVSFGRAMGYMNNNWIDVHGAGAQRSDPKTGDANKWPTGHGPQGDAIRIDNYVRCVRDDATVTNTALGSDAPTAADTAVVATPNASEPGMDSVTQPPAANGSQPTQPDLAAAAAQLGVTEQALREALGPPPPDLAAAAAQLGVRQEALAAALGVPIQLP